jgi:predicted GIY-YIG superfamily endonuclease
MFYTYVLLSEKDSKFYTGFTEDLKLRLKEIKGEQLNQLVIDDP